MSAIRKRRASDSSIPSAKRPCTTSSPPLALDAVDVIESLPLELTDIAEQFSIGLAHRRNFQHVLRLLFWCDNVFMEPSNRVAWRNMGEWVHRLVGHAERCAATDLASTCPVFPVDSVHMPDSSPLWS